MTRELHEPEVTRLKYILIPPLLPADIGWGGRVGPPDDGSDDRFSIDLADHEAEARREDECLILALLMSSHAHENFLRLTLIDD